MTEAQRNIYAQALLETLSFQLYAYTPKGHKQAVEEFSAFTRCAESVDATRWRPIPWSLGQDLENTVADQLYGTIAPIVCKSFLGQGDMTLRPVRMMSKSTWQRLSVQDKAIYLMGYVETGQAFARRRGDHEMQRAIKICIESVGIEGLLGALDRITYEWQHPLPWSISKAFGAACKPNR